MNTEEQKASELVATAVKTALEVTETAAGAAKDVVAAAADAAATARQESHDDDDRVTRALATALRRVFGENEEKQRFVDVTRIPLLCKSIESIHGDIKDIKETLETGFVRKDDFQLVRGIVFGFVAMIVVSFVGALLSLVFIR